MLSSQVVSHTFFFLVSSSLSAVVCSCGMCFGWFYVVLGCFMKFSVSCFNWCLDVSIFECCFRLTKLFNVCNRYGLFQVIFMLFSVVSG